MCAGDVGRTFDGGLHIDQSEVRSTIKNGAEECGVILFNIRFASQFFDL
jgi:hypothetical protein